ncbi:endonuclease III [Sutterella seckii]|uniref:Endonuclease III n=1 Tax=Sutterella seckii TaxID=1944635 RepID=A0A6I1ERP5_9BURK|nr:endonuclease III [Sutterella seckii]KAB7651567.1 endonuclease III [Sutterella seckii]
MPVLKKDRAAFMAALAKLNPDPKSELNYTTPFDLLIAVMLSAQATDKGVNLATAKLFPVANTPEKILALGLENLTAYVNTINLYRTKAAHIMEACRILVDQYGGEVPRTMKELVALPGVGRKTANVVLNVAFHEPTIAVDTHIFRVCNRTGFATGKTPTEVEEKLLKIVPDEFKLNAHHWLLLFGRYLCKARNPECTRCPVANFCNAPEKKAALAAAAEEAADLVPGTPPKKPARRKPAAKKAPD